MTHNSVDGVLKDVALKLQTVAEKRFRDDVDDDMHPRGIQDDSSPVKTPSPAITPSAATPSSNMPPRGIRDDESPEDTPEVRTPVAATPVKFKRRLPLTGVPFAAPEILPVNEWVATQVKRWVANEVDSSSIPYVTGFTGYQNVVRVFAVKVGATTVTASSDHDSSLSPSSRFIKRVNSRKDRE